MRGIIVREEPLMLKPGQLYVLASAVGCGLFVWLAIYSDLGSLRAGLAAIAITFIIRVLAIRFNWHTAPVRGWREPLFYMGARDTGERPKPDSPPPDDPAR